MVWTPLKNISQLGWLFPIYGRIKNVPNHQPDNHWGSPMTMEPRLREGRRLRLWHYSSHGRLEVNMALFHTFFASTGRPHGGVHKWGYPNNWMVYFRENPNLKWMITRGVPPWLRKPPKIIHVFQMETWWLNQLSSAWQEKNMGLDGFHCWE